MPRTYTNKRGAAGRPNAKRHAAKDVVVESATTPPRNRSRIIVLLFVLICATILLLFRIRFGAVSQRERLYLGNGLILGPAPPVPASNLKSLQDKFRRIEQAREALALRKSDKEAQFAFGAAALAAGDPLSAEPALYEAIRLDPHPGPDQYFEIGWAQDMLGDCKRAMSTYLRMSQAYPLDERAYVAESQTFDRLHRRTDAVHALELGLKSLPPDDVAGRIHIINQFDAFGDAVRALKEAEILRLRLPSNSQAILTAVHYLIKVQEPVKARSLLVELLARDPANAQAHFAMGVVLCNPQMPDVDMPGAENELLQAIKLAPDDQIYYNRLGELYLDLGKYMQCAYVSLQILAMEPDSATARTHLATSLAHIGQSKEAVEQGEIASRLLARDREKTNLQTVVSEQSSDPFAYLELARHYVKYADFANALPLFEAAYALAPTDRSARNKLAVVCKDIGISLPQLPALEK